MKIKITEPTETQSPKTSETNKNNKITENNRENDLKLGFLLDIQNEKSNYITIARNVIDNI